MAILGCNEMNDTHVFEEGASVCYCRKRIRLKDETEAKRNPSAYRYDVIAASFLEAMASIGAYGAITYGDFNWHKSRLEGDKGPINHIYKHLTSYREAMPYDHLEVGKDRKFHLAAIAFNAMMEWWYEENCDDIQTKRN